MLHVYKVLAFWAIKAGHMVHDGAQSPEKKLVLVAGLPRFFKVSHTRIFQGILAEPNISRSFDAFELEQEWLLTPRSSALQCELCLCQAPRTEYTSTL